MCDRMSLREEIVIYCFGKLPWRRLGEAILVSQAESDCQFCFVDHQWWKTHTYPWQSNPVFHYYSQLSDFPKIYPGSFWLVFEPIMACSVHHCYGEEIIFFLFFLFCALGFLPLIVLIDLLLNISCLCISLNIQNHCAVLQLWFTVQK